MKNKTKTYILLVAVLAIWSVIGFKILSTLNPEAPTVNKQDDTVFFTPMNNKAIDTFSVQPSKRDPFLGTLYVTKPKTNQKKSSLKKEVVWPPIIYNGTISKQDSKPQVFVISINGQQHIMRVGQEIDGISLLRASMKEILVSYKGSRKTIIKL